MSRVYLCRIVERVGSKYCQNTFYKCAVLSNNPYKCTKQIVKNSIKGFFGERKIYPWNTIIIF